MDWRLNSRHSYFVMFLTPTVLKLFFNPSTGRDIDSQIWPTPSAPTGVGTWKCSLLPKMALLDFFRLFRLGMQIGEMLKDQFLAFTDTQVCLQIPVLSWSAQTFYEPCKCFTNRSWDPRVEKDGLLSFRWLIVWWLMLNPKFIHLISLIEVSGTSWCGNYRIDDGEACDAGYEGKKNNDPCCDSSCQLKPPAHCRWEQTNLYHVCRRGSKGPAGWGMHSPF